ncbi:MAG: HpcH/HpaI aldolase/citrate lyase family protein [Gammaproteobacteria bacterium]|nr:HpcH/HpaI aldolase/citrate lyase family protein [Gammaproteobacteria bacterium]MCP5425712.1 HpcH/HpaI aldolase/citrate lyase family protein [Gammaproteobacteria bacterium]
MHESIVVATAFIRDQLTRIGALALGASLYVPAIRPDLGVILNRRQFPKLKSVIVCLEDAIYERDIPAALANLEHALDQSLPKGLQRFLRPRDSSMLKRLLRMKNIGAIQGFVLPKVSELNIGHYAELAAQRPDLWLMPTLEGDIAFHRDRLQSLCTRLLEADNPVLCVRTGGNDLLRLLGLHRPRNTTLYETPLRGVLEDLIKIFKPAGFAMAAPVFGYLDDLNLLRLEIERDIAYGFVTKAALSPSQVVVIEKAFRVDGQDYESAQALLGSRAPAVFKMHGQMLEVAVHREWARHILARADLFGVKAE